MAMNWLALGSDTVNSGVQIYQANKRQKEYGAERTAHETEIQTLKDNRVDIPDLSEPIEDLSGNLTNPFANLSVATQAAEIQMEQTDIALANTLDTIRATGGAAGGATALAQAALQSKKGVSATIEQQEVNNQKLSAQGEQRLQEQQMAEKQRVQSAEAAALEFTFGAEEARTSADLDYEAGMEGRYAQMEYDARLQKEQAINKATSEITSGFADGDYFAQ